MLMSYGGCLTIYYNTLVFPTYVLCRTTYSVFPAYLYHSSLTLYIRT